MKEIVILSGKGGTGKTTVAASFSHLAHKSERCLPVLVDADVDAANLELVLSPRIKEKHEFVGGKVATIDSKLCIACGTCAEVCRFEAIIPPPNVDEAEGMEVYKVDPIACEGCATCYYQCPVEAIRMEDRVVGEWLISETRFGPLVHAHLFPAQENSGKLVSLIKRQARRIALDGGHNCLIVDGPPGIGCPVIAACTGADLALIVTEPTVAGIHDLERVLATTKHFQVPSLVCINKYDINPAQTHAIMEYCAEQGIEVVGLIPFDPKVVEAMVQGIPVTEHKDGPASEQLCRMWERVHAQLS